jgi:hypothetical protein
MTIYRVYEDLGRETVDYGCFTTDRAAKQRARLVWETKGYPKRRMELSSGTLVTQSDGVRFRVDVEAIPVDVPRLLRTRRSA